MKKHIRYELKEMLSPIIATFIVMAAIFWIYMMNNNITQTYYNTLQGIIAYNTGESGLICFTILAMLATVYLPLYTFSYRYKKNRADAYLQLPLKEGELKRIRLITSICLLLIVVTIVYWVGVSIEAYRVASFTTLYDSSGGIRQEAAPYNFIGYLYAYFFLLLFVAAEYFINSYLIQLGNNPGDSLLYCIFGQVILGLIVFAPWAYSSAYLGVSSNTAINFGFTFSFASPMVYMHQVFNNYITGQGNLFYGTWTFATYCSFLGPILIGIGAAIILFFQKDPSGEHYGKNGERHPAIKIIPHGAFGLTGLLTICGTLSFFSLIFWALGYYFVEVYLNRGLKIKKVDLIIMLSVIALILILYVVGIIVASRSGRYIW